MTEALVSTTTTPLLVQTQVLETPFSEITRTNGQTPVMLLLLQILQAIQTMNDTCGTKMNEIHNQREGDQNQILQYMQLADELANMIYSLKEDGFEGLAEWKNSAELGIHIHDQQLSEKKDKSTTKTLDNVSGTCFDQNVFLNLEQKLLTYNIKLEGKMEHMMMENLRVINILERERHIYKDAFQSEINKRDITISQKEEEILELKEEIKSLHMNYSKLSEGIFQKMKLEEDKRIERISEKLENIDYNLEEIHLTFFMCLPYLRKLANNHKKLLNVYDIETLQRTETLLKNNDGNKDKALLRACETGDLNATKILLEAGANTSARSEYMPLHHAAYSGYVEVARLLLDYGADIEGRAETWSTTPAHVAAFWGQPTVLKLLLERKANVNALNKIDNTPLHDAAGQGHMKEMKLLIEYGADRSIRNNEGYTPEEWAYRWGKNTAAQWLEDS